MANRRKRQSRAEGKAKKRKRVLVKCKGFPRPQKTVNTYPVSGVSWGLHHPLNQPTNHVHACPRASSGTVYSALCIVGTASGFEPRAAQPQCSRRPPSKCAQVCAKPGSGHRIVRKMNDGSCMRMV